MGGANLEWVEQIWCGWNKLGVGGANLERVEQMGKWRTQSDQLPTPTTLSGCAAWECCSNLRLHPIQLAFILLLLIFFFYLFIYSCNELCIVLYCIVLLVINSFILITYICWFSCEI